VESITERLSLYTRLDSCDKESELQEFHKEMTDRFGPVPAQVEDLFTTVRCRWMAVEIGFEKMSLKEDTLRCYFINRPDSPYFESQLFKRVLIFLQKSTNKGRLKQTGKLFLLMVDDVKDMKSMYRFLEQMYREVVEKK
jgi:transcription-repair coupling factor (superfamily II helicase)